METKTENKAEQNKKARNTIGFLLTIVMLGLTIFVLYIQSENYKVLEVTTDLALNANDKQSGNYRHYIKEYVTTKSQLMDAQSRLGKMTLELELVSKELESTKSVLSETQTLLAQYQQGNAPQTIVKEGQKNLGDMKKQNENYSGELVKLKNELDSYQLNANDLKEGSSLIAELKGKIRTIREKMNALRKEARDAKAAAQEERDRQLVMMGNNGYATKDGELILVSKGQKTVDIDVKFVP